MQHRGKILFGGGFGLAITTVVLMVSSGKGDQAKEDTKPPALKLAQSRVYTLEELSTMLRQETGSEVYVDRRHATRRLFVSKGEYPVPALLQAIRRATGMELRKVDMVSFFAARDMTFGHRLNFPAMPQGLLDRLGKSLRPVGETVDLKKERIPWDSAEFLTRRMVPFNELTPEQQKFARAVFRPMTEGGSLKAIPGRKPIDLDGKTVRLGTSYLIYCSVSVPAQAADKPDEQLYLKVKQIYYDYRDRFGIPLSAED